MTLKHCLHWGLTLFVCLALYAEPPAPSSPPAVHLPDAAEVEQALGHPLSTEELQEWELVGRLHTMLAVMYRDEVAKGEAFQAEHGEVPGPDTWSAMIRRLGLRVLKDIRPITPKTSVFDVLKNA